MKGIEQRKPVKINLAETGEVSTSTKGFRIVKHLERQKVMKGE